MKLFITILVSILFLILPACVDKKVVKKDKKKDDANKYDKIGDNYKHKKYKGSSVDSKENDKGDKSSEEKRVEAEKERKRLEEERIKAEKIKNEFSFSQELSFENASVFAENFSKQEEVESELSEKFYSTILFLDHSNKYDELKSILPMLRNMENVPEEIKTINKRYNVSYDTNKIGIIIPKNSRYKKLATDIENGIKLAKSRYKNNFDIVIKETDGSFDSTIKATEELIFDDKVFIILGTIRSSNSRAVNLITDKYRVPFISMSRDSSFIKSSKYSFSYYASLKFSARFMAKFAIEKLKIKNFAIFYPNSEYGNENMVEFWKSVEEFGGKITSVRTYSPTKEADYIVPAEKLVGRHYLGSRYDYIKKKNKLRKLKSGHSLKKSLETLKKDLEPKIDFEALYIPDGGEATTILLPYLALYDINFKTGNHWQHKLARMKAKDKNYKLKFVQLLGTQTWASDSISQGAGKYIQGAIFPVVYDSRIDDKTMSKFTSLYARKYSKKPSMYSLYGYEIFNIINKLVTKNLESSDFRKHFVDGLLIKNFKVISGEVKFNQYGEAIKTLFLMKFNSEKYKSYK